MGSDTQNAPEVFVAVDEIPLAQPFAIVVTVCSDTAVNDIDIDAIMPAHQHGLNYTPKVTPLGDGVFRVDDMVFHMPGLWQVKVDVLFDGQSMSYISDIVLK